MRPFGSRGCHLLAERPLIWVPAEWKFFCFRVRPRLLINNAGRMWGRRRMRPIAQRAAAALTQAKRPRLFLWGPRPPSPASPGASEARHVSQGSTAGRKGSNPGLALERESGVEWKLPKDF